MLVWLLLFFVRPILWAEGPDNLYLQIYALIQDGDSAAKESQPSQALAKYSEAQAALLRIKKDYPDWNAEVVKFRLTYLAEQIGTILAKMPADQTSAPAIVGSTNQAAAAKPENAARMAELENQLAAAKEEARQLQADKALLEAKLKEALAAQPAAIDPKELAKAEEKARALEKERDLLTTSLAMQQAKAAEEAAKAAKTNNAANAFALAQARNEVASLRALLEVFEARKVPYTPEELALFSKPEPKPVPIPAVAATNAPSQPASASVATGTNAPTQPAPAANVAEKRPAATLSPAAATLIAEAQKCFRAKQFDEAEAKYSAVIREAPENVTALGNLAVIQMQMGKLDEAEKTVQKTVQLAPEDSFAQFVFGHLRFQQKKYDEALEHLAKAAQLDPQNAEVQNFLGITLSQKGQRIPAETALRKALQLQPSYAEAHRNLAVVYATHQPPAIEMARWHYKKSVSLGQAADKDFEQLLQEKAQKN